MELDFPNTDHYMETTSTFPNPVKLLRGLDAYAAHNVLVNLPDPAAQTEHTPAERRAGIFYHWLGFIFTLVSILPFILVGLYAWPSSSVLNGTYISFGIVVWFAAQFITLLVVQVLVYCIRCIGNVRYCWGLISDNFQETLSMETLSMDENAPINYTPDDTFFETIAFCILPITLECARLTAICIAPLGTTFPGIYSIAIGSCLLPSLQPINTTLILMCCGTSNLGSLRALRQAQRLVPGLFSGMSWWMFGVEELRLYATAVAFGVYYARLPPLVVVGIALRIMSEKGELFRRWWIPPGAILIVDTMVAAGLLIGALALEGRL